MISEKQFYQMAGVEQHSQFEKFLQNILLNKSERETFYKKIIDLDPQCVNEDIFKQYFEDYSAERKSNKQDLTPTGIAELLSELTNNNKSSNWTVIDSAAGTGTLLINKWQKERLKFLPWNYKPSNYFYLAQEKSDITIPYLIHNMAIRGMNVCVIHGDTLAKTAKQVYFIQNAKNDALSFSSVNVMPHSDGLARYLGINEWTEEPINHIEDTLEDVKWLFSKKEGV